MRQFPIDKCPFCKVNLHYDEKYSDVPTYHCTLKVHSRSPKYPCESHYAVSMDPKQNYITKGPPCQHIIVPPYEILSFGNDEGSLIHKYLPGTSSGYNFIMKLNFTPHLFSEEQLINKIKLLIPFS